MLHYATYGGGLWHPWQWIHACQSNAGSVRWVQMRSLAAEDWVSSTLDTGCEGRPTLQQKTERSELILCLPARGPLYTTDDSNRFSRLWWLASLPTLRLPLHFHGHLPTPRPHHLGVPWHHPPFKTRHPDAIPHQQILWFPNHLLGWGVLCIMYHTQRGMRPISCWCHALIMHWTWHVFNQYPSVL